MSTHLLTRRSFALSGAALSAGAVLALTGCAEAPLGGLRNLGNRSPVSITTLACGGCPKGCPAEISVHDGMYQRVNALATPLCAAGYQWILGRHDAPAPEKTSVPGKGAAEKYAGVETIVFVGLDPTDEASAVELAAVQQAREQGAAMALVGPRLAGASVFIDDYIPLAPGSEAALLCALASELVASGSYDKSAGERFPEGFSSFLAWARSLTTERASETTGIASSTIASLAQLIGRDPASSLIVCSDSSNHPAALIGEALAFLLRPGDAEAAEGNRALIDACVEVAQEALPTHAYRLSRPSQAGFSAAGRDEGNGAETFKKASGNNCAQVSPDTAAMLGLIDGDAVLITSSAASGTFKVLATAGVHDRCVYLPSAAGTPELVSGDVVSLKKVGA